jgi:uncharacterized membrane protein YbhN (UPF0104 family)
VLAVCAAVIVLLLRRVDPSSILRQTSHVSWRLVGFAIALNLVPTLLRAARSQLLVRRLGHPVPFLRMNGVDLAGQTLSWITPAATGDLARPYMWRTHDRVPVTAGVAVVVYERLVTLGQMGAIGGVLAAAIYLPPAAVAGLAVAACAALAAPWWVSHLTRGHLSRQAGAERGGILGGLLRSLLRLEDLGLSARLTAAFAAFSLLIFLVSGLQVVVLAWAVGAGTGLGVGIAAYCISQVAGSVSTLPFGIGAADLVTWSLLMAGGMPRAEAVAVTLLVRLAVTLPLGVAGALGIAVLGRPRLTPEPSPAAPQG